MRYFRILILACLLLISVVSCNLFMPENSSLEPTLIPDASASAPTFAPPQPAATATPDSLPADMLSNFTYMLPYLPDGRIPLKNGEFSFSQENPPIRIQSKLLQTAFGDLNGDGVEDALVVLATNTGGSGTFFDLIALLNQAGQPIQVANTSLGDRQVINSLRIDNTPAIKGQIILDYLTQGPKDGLCCPSQHMLSTYKLEGGLLSLSSQQILADPNVQATPLPNLVIIDQPQSTELVTGIVEVRGRVSQTPPDGKLAYALTGLNGDLLQQGELMVQGNPGNPGAFAAQIQLDSNIKNYLQLEITDTRDGLLYGRSVIGVLIH